MLHNKRTLTPVVSAIILIAVTVAAAIAATSSMGSVSFNFMKTEELRITGCMWAPDFSYANITVSNFGSNAVSINSVQLDGTAVAEYTFVSGDSTVDAGETVTIKVFDFFLGNVSHQFSVITKSGTGFVFVAAAPQTSATFRMESGTIENVNDEFTQVNLEKDISVGGFVSSNQGAYFVGNGLEHYADPPKTVMSHGYLGFDTSHFYALDAQAQQYLADIAARKALIFNSSELQKEEVNGESGLIWEPISIQATFHVRKTGNYWEAIQGDTQYVAFGGSEGAGGVNGSDGGAVLNAAINAASVAGGGRVTIGRGNLLADQITPKSYVDICGEGKDTVLRQNANANTIFIYSGEKIVNFSMHDLTIDYNHQNQSSPQEGMWIGYASEYVHLYKLWIENCKKFGIHLASMDQPSDPPISCENAKVEDIIFTDVIAQNSDLCVVASHGGYIRNVTIYGLHRNAGIVAYEGTNLQVTDCHVTIESQDGEIVGCIWLGSCKYSLCANNTIFGQTMNGSYETIGIRVNKEHDNTNPRDSYKNLVTDNHVTTIRHGIMLEETSDDYVVSNILTDCTNGIVFPNYGNPAASNPKIILNSLNNVTNPIREFVTPIGMQQYLNKGVSASYIP